jgi:hypothetical protein
MNVQKRFENVLRRYTWPPRPHEEADKGDQDRAQLRELFDVLSADTVFQMGAVRVALRWQAVELFTVSGRIGAWFADTPQLFYLAEANLPRNDFVPVPDQRNAEHWASTVGEAAICSHLIIQPLITPLSGSRHRRMQAT